MSRAPTSARDGRASGGWPCPSGGAGGGRLEGGGQGLYHQGGDGQLRQGRGQLQHAEQLLAGGVEADHVEEHLEDHHGRARHQGS